VKNCYDGLQVVEKRAFGVRVGYVVGWWFFPRRHWGAGHKQEASFRSFRNGVIFKKKSAALEFRDKVEKMRTDAPPVITYTNVETD